MSTYRLYPKKESFREAMTLEEDRLRLKKLLEHGIEHSREHEQRFREWTDKAEAMGLTSVSPHLSQAVNGMEEVAKSLQKALDKLD